MLIYKGDSKKVKAATEIANTLLGGGKGFYTSVSNFNYTHSDISGKQLTKYMSTIHIKYEIKIELKCYWNPFSKMIAVFNPSKPLLITLNKRRLSRDIHSIVGTLVHEFCHVTDNQYAHITIGHGDNSSDGKERSIPYAVGRMAENLSKAYYDTKI